MAKKDSSEGSEGPTPEELREQALTVLKDSGVSGLSAAYLVGEDYGPVGTRAVHNFKYIPALTEPTKPVSQMITNGLLSSRQDGKYYTGNLSEFQLIKGATDLRNQALGAVTIQDVYELAGSKEKAPAKYADMTLAKLSESEDETDKKFYDKLTKTYALAFRHGSVEESLGAERKAAVGGLEKEVSE